MIIPSCYLIVALLIEHYPFTKKYPSMHNEQVLVLLQIWQLFKQDWHGLEEFLMKYPGRHVLQKLFGQIKQLESPQGTHVFDVPK